jgi:hypothetical protein
MPGVIIVGGRKPKDLSEFNWINTILGNLKTSLGALIMRSISPNAELVTSAPSRRCGHYWASSGILATLS